VSLQRLKDQQILNPKTIWELGIGSIDSRTIIDTTSSSSSSNSEDGTARSTFQFMSTILKANSIQIALSFIYFTYNGLFTSVASAKEWGRFVNERKGLRVSTIPQGAQRGTYLLSLPFRVALPLMGLSVLLHWLVSQALFIVSVEAYKNGQRYYDWDILSCGFSPLAIILLFVVCLGMFGWLVYMGTQKVPSAMPLVGSCSAAIAAACHPGLVEEEDPYKTIKYGLIEMYSPVHGHCGFSSRTVSTPEVNELYI
jgi:hypothetical protein